MAKNAENPALAELQKYFKYAGAHGLLMQREPQLLKRPELYEHSRNRPLVYGFTFEPGARLDLDKLHRLIQAHSLSKNEPVAVTSHPDGRLFSVVVGSMIRQGGEAHRHFSQFHEDGFRLSLDQKGLIILRQIVSKSIIVGGGENG